MASQNEIAIYYSNSIKVTIWRLTLLTATMCSTKNGDHNFLLSGIIICKKYLLTWFAVFGDGYVCLTKWCFKLAKETIH